MKNSENRGFPVVLKGLIRPKEILGCPLGLESPCQVEVPKSLWPKMVKIFPPKEVQTWVAKTFLPWPETIKVGFQNPSNPNFGPQITLFAWVRTSSNGPKWNLPLTRNTNLRVNQRWG